MRKPERTDGFAPIEDYALIGDGQACALVAADGAIDWLCLPSLDAPPVLYALLDPENGGRFSLCPRKPFEVLRRYVDHCNILETVFTTEDGTAKVSDAFLTDGGDSLPWSELVRKIEGIEGEVEFEWRLSARPRWGRCDVSAELRENVGLISWDTDTIAILSYDCGSSKTDRTDVHGKFTIEESRDALLAALYFDDQPYALPPRGELEARFDRTRTYWETYTRDIPYAGSWRGPVRRGVLTQRLLTFEPSGAIAAAPTTSLPEKIGGDRNWDYRFSWVRDTSLALESLLAARLSAECQRSLAWVIEASRQSDQLQPMYTLRGESDLPREDIDVPGWRNSQPVRVGNDAQDQLQLGGYADVIDAAYRFCDHGHMLDARSAERCAELADDVCELWQRDDAGIWEIDPKPYTLSKIACWSALEHALQLAADNRLPDAGAKRWKSTQSDIRDWVESNGWSDEKGAYVIHPGSDGLDAAVLLGARFGYFEPGDERFTATIEAIRSELGEGPLLYRTSELRGKEGCFLACSFWLVDALARQGRLDEARPLMEELVGLANDVGLYSEQMDPKTHAFLGNFPQALTHLSLILSAVSVMRVERHGV